MLGFMQWTHRTYPYGPSWLLISIPLSYVGLQIFLPTLILFKTLAVGGYLGSIYFIERIVKKIFPGKELLAVVFFAFNPLIIIELLVSGHHDGIMMFLTLASFYFILEKKYGRALLLFVLSVGIKYVTIFLFPIFSAIVVMQVMKKKIPWKSFIATLLACMFFGVLAASQHSGNFQPWYLLFILPFVALVGFDAIFTIPAIILSISGLLTYVPFLYLGNWNKPVPDYLQIMYLGTLSLCVGIMGILYFKRKSPTP
jgi:Gpi18-like mannosyltransferase